MDAYLGIDGGGSGSRWMVLNEEAAELAGGAGPAMQVQALGPVEVVARLRTILATARAQAPEPSAVVIDLAGTGDPALRQQLADSLVEHVDDVPMRLIADPVAAAGVALRAGPAVAAWAGTGSFAIARDGHGRLCRVGGRGAMLGDQGSAYQLVVKAGRAALAAGEEIMPATLLGQSLSHALELETVFGLESRMKAMTVQQIAALAPVVCSAAEEGDEVAKAVLRAGAKDLADVTFAAACRAGLDHQTLDVAIGGGLFTSPIYRECFASSLSAVGIDHPPRQGGETVRGAALLAKDLSMRSAPFYDWLNDGTST